MFLTSYASLLESLSCMSKKKRKEKKKKKKKEY